MKKDFTQEEYLDVKARIDAGESMRSIGKSYGMKPSSRVYLAIRRKAWEWPGMPTRARVSVAEMYKRYRDDAGCDNDDISCRVEWLYECAKKDPHFSGFTGLGKVSKKDVYEFLARHGCSLAGIYQPSDKCESVRVFVPNQVLEEVSAIIERFKHGQGLK